MLTIPAWTIMVMTCITEQDIITRTIMSKESAITANLSHFPQSGEKMVIVKEVEGNILDAKEKWIAQQCNCVTIKSHGLSAAITARFPYANPYAGRRAQSANTAAASARDRPGSIRIMSPEEEEDGDGKDIICMFAQWAPGKPMAYARHYPNPPNGDSDNAEARVLWFTECLHAIEADESIDGPVAVPFQIGCGLAGGAWHVYEGMLRGSTTEFAIYRLPSITGAKRTIKSGAGAGAGVDMGMDAKKSRH